MTLLHHSRRSLSGWNPVGGTVASDSGVGDSDLVIIEDTCEAHGARFEGKMVRTFGALGSFSFYFSHHISTIEGGIVVTDDPALADLARMLRAHGWTRDVNRDGVADRLRACTRKADERHDRRVGAHASRSAREAAPSG